MCEVCRLEGHQSKVINGKKKLKEAKLYRVYVGQWAKMALCHIHSIELFCIGETRFLLNHLKLAQDLGVNKEKYVVSFY